MAVAAVSALAFASDGEGEASTADVAGAEAGAQAPRPSPALSLPGASAFAGDEAALGEYLMTVTTPWGRWPWGGGGVDPFAELLVLSERLGRADMAYVATGGKKGVRPAWTSAVYPEAAVAVMRSGWVASADPPPTYAAVSLWEPSVAASCAPLSLVLSAGGRDLLVAEPADGGSGYFRGSLPFPAGAAEEQIVGGDVRAWAAAGSFAYIDVEYEVGGGRKVRRRVVFDGGALVVADGLTAAGGCAFSQVWMPAPGATPSWPDGGKLVFSWQGASLCVAQARASGSSSWREEARPLTDHEMGLLTRYGAARGELPEGPWRVEMDASGLRTACVWDPSRGGGGLLRFFRLGDGRVEFATALVPSAGDGSGVRLRRLLPDRDGSGLALELSAPDREEMMVFSDERAWRTFNAGRVGFDGRLLCVVRDASGRLSHLWWLGGRRAELDGRLLASSDSPVDFLEVEYAEDTVRIRSLGADNTLVVATFGRSYFEVDGVSGGIVFPDSGRIKPYASRTDEAGLVVDDADAAFSVGDALAWRRWFRRVDVAGCRGLSYMQAKGEDAVSPDACATWRPTLPAGGLWEVLVRWPDSRAGRVKDAVYAIGFRKGGRSLPPAPGGAVVEIDGSALQDGQIRIHVDQSAAAGEWVSLGQYDFPAGGGGYVSLWCGRPDGGVVVADAVKFLRR